MVNDKDKIENVPGLTIPKVDIYYNSFMEWAFGDGTEGCMKRFDDSIMKEFEEWKTAQC